jgi:uncharacterized protein YcbX
MRVTSIHTYPIKGCYRVDQDRATVEPWGLAGDRRWLIVDADTGRALTQREEPGLTRIRPVPLPAGGGLKLRTTGWADLVVAVPVDTEAAEATLFGQPMTAVRAESTADDWLSALLARKVFLAWQADPTRRQVEPAYARPGDSVSLADGYPVLVANEASLAVLNDWLLAAASYGGAESDEGPLPMTRFRPNLVVAGGPAWVEDTWLGGRVRIGGVEFRVPKACARCVVTTTDQETGVRGREPLRTLARHRHIEHGLLFAVNLIPDTLGDIAVGDEVAVV